MQHSGVYDFVFVVLVYRNTADLHDFFAALKVANSKVVVVNSYYDDDTEKEFRRLATENGADFISVPNKGYGYGNNRGCEYALQHYSFRYLVIANSDVTIDRLCIDDICQWTDVIIAPEIRTGKGKRQNPNIPYRESRLTEWLRYQSYERGWRWPTPCFDALSRLKKIYFFAVSRFQSPRYVYSAHGAFLVMPFNVLQLLHPLFDDVMFMYNEERFLSRKARQAQVRTVYVPQVKVLHKWHGSVSLGSIGEYTLKQQSFIRYYQYWCLGGDTLHGGVDAGQLVSIIMPAYNSGAYIAEAIRSIQAQTYQQWELLLVDDCSTDNTEEIVRTFSDTRVHYINNKSRIGTAASRNLALRHARGRWIAFLDSDDMWEPFKLERQLAFMQEHDYSFSYTCYREMDRQGVDTGLEIRGPRHITRRMMSCYNWLGCLTVMYDAWKTGMVQVVDIDRCNDYAIWLKVSRRADCYLLDECLARYRRRPMTMGNFLTRIKFHYRLRREGEYLSLPEALLMTAVTLVSGAFKKLMYVRQSSPSVSLLLQLLRSALWGTSFKRTYSESELRQVMELAGQQTVDGLAVAALSSQHVDADRKLILGYVGKLSKIQRTNMSVSVGLNDFVSRMEQNHIEFLVVKGLTLAVDYPEPLLRVSGDIDFVVRGDYADWRHRVEETLHVELPPKLILKEKTFKRNGVFYDLHRELLVFGSRRHSCYWETLMAEAWDNPYYVETAGVRVPTLPPTLNVVYLFVHLFFHLVREGVSLRQMCDWAVFLHAHHADIDRDQLTQMLIRLDVLKAFRAFGCVMVDCLGLNTADFPAVLLPDDARWKSRILNDMISGGNFGRRNHIRCFKRMRKAETLWIAFRNTICYYHLAPTEVRLLIPRLLKRNIRLLKGRFCTNYT